MEGKWQKRALALLAWSVVAGFVIALFIPARAYSPIAAARTAYYMGKITLEEARHRVGDDVDTSDWPEMKARWEASQKQAD